MTKFARLRINADVTIVQLASLANIARGTIEKMMHKKNALCTGLIP